MGGAFFTGLAGLVANSLGIETVGNNLANSNTVGFKANNIFFQELISSNNQFLKLGQGVLPARIAEDFSQGGLQRSQVPTDMSIQGAGYFIVGDGASSRFFTRAGNFRIGNNGQLSTSGGLFVLGYPAVNGQVDSNSELVPIDISPNTNLDPQVTSTIRFVGNLDSGTAVGEKYTTAITVFDSLGASHQVTLEFTKTAAGWDYEISVPAVDVGGAAGDPPTVVESGSLTFTGTGALDTVTTTAGPVPAGEDVTGITITGFSNGAADLVLTWDLFNDTGNGNFTQFEEASQTTFTFQDGNSAGILSSFVVQDNGVIQGLFTNGETSPLGQIALAKFVNPQGLSKVASNLYSRTGVSGDPTVGEPNSGGRGIIRGNTLESSNVEIAEEFIKLIIFQRAYQANSRLVITADEVTQEAIALKR